MAKRKYPQQPNFGSSGKVGGKGTRVVGCCGSRCCCGGWDGIVGSVIPEVIKDFIKFLLLGLFSWDFSYFEWFKEFLWLGGGTVHWRFDSEMRLGVAAGWSGDGGGGGGVGMAAGVEGVGVAAGLGVVGVAAVAVVGWIESGKEGVMWLRSWEAEPGREWTTVASTGGRAKLVREPKSWEGGGRAERDWREGWLAEVAQFLEGACCGDDVATERNEGWGEVRDGEAEVVGDEGLEGEMELSV
ncbi:hypothetical protein CYMTET_45086 [Cymbomonas tetramitiformis]|uniref:Uncharacterized protein n=1 Tax=Cymbomonas tetramitiformis TaxID=36881 RepID=A0AAE0EYD7_9CHLO|nr:hypothetical protein CYMTET_45086 [Cymbomonas tetramitiformis]